MGKPNFSALIPEVIQKKIEWLSERMGINKTQVVIAAIRLLYDEERKKSVDT